jgi:hypothetical protein
LCGAHEVIARLSKSRQVSDVSSVALLFPLGIGLLRLALACFVTAIDHDDDSWHLWPLFTLFHLAFFGTLSLSATVLSWAVIRLGKRRGT